MHDIKLLLISIILIQYLKYEKVKIINKLYIIEWN